MFDNVVELLVARGALEWMGTHLLEGKNAVFLNTMYTAAVDRGLFELERETIEALGSIKITISMLEGK